MPGLYALCARPLRKRKGGGSVNLFCPSSFTVSATKASCRRAAVLGEVCLVSLTEPGLRPLHGCRRGADVDVDVLHLLAGGQQLYALSLQLLNAQALYLAKLLHLVHLLFSW